MLQFPPIASNTQYIYFTFSRYSGNWGGAVKIGGDIDGDGTMNFYTETAIGVGLDAPWAAPSAIYLADGTTSTFSYSGAGASWGYATCRLILSLGTNTMTYQIKPTYDSTPAPIPVGSQAWSTQFSNVNALTAFGGAARGDPSKWDSVIFQSAQTSTAFDSFEVKVVPTGYYRDSSLEVYPCAAGTYSTGMGVTACTTCPSTSFSTDGSSTCTCLTAGLTFINGQCISSCAAGQVINGTGCSNCTAGKYSTSIGAQTCSTCLAGESVYNARPNPAQCDLK